MKRAQVRVPGVKGGAKSAWAQGLLLGALAVAAPGLAVLAGVLLLPGLVAAAMAGRAWRAEARCVLLAGVAMSVAPLLALWRDGAGIEAAMAALGQGDALPLAWGAAGLAWLLAEAGPLVLASAMEARAANRIARLRDEHAALSGDWTAPDANSHASMAAQARGTAAQAVG
jgi:hypothetical protein